MEIAATPPAVVWAEFRGPTAAEAAAVALPRAGEAEAGEAVAVVVDGRRSENPLLQRSWTQS